MSICLVTSSKSKLKETALVLEGFELEAVPLELEEPKTQEQEEVVRRKAEQAFSLINRPVLVDDT